MKLQKLKTHIKNQITILKEQEDKIANDVQKVADSSLLKSIGNADEWVGMMNLLYTHANTIKSVNDSIKKSTLQGLIKKIGKEDTPKNGEL